MSAPAVASKSYGVFQVRVRSEDDSKEEEEERAGSSAVSAMSTYISCYLLEVLMKVTVLTQSVRDRMRSVCDWLRTVASRAISLFVWCRRT